MLATDGQTHQTTAALLGCYNYRMSSPAINFGLPKDTFYWGPSRAEPAFMADFVLAFAGTFTWLAADPRFPAPPDTAALFLEGKTVWLINQAAWSEFVKATFKAYIKTHNFDENHAEWLKLRSQLDAAAKARRFDSTTADLLVAAQQATILPELSLYGSSAAVHGLLDRFPESIRQDIWATFTAPDQPPFSQALDSELAAGRDPAAMAKKYPWIVDGYFGVGTDAKAYFETRLKVIDDNETGETVMSQPHHRRELAEQTGLSQDELSQLQLVSQLAGFMDERKRWMMQTRRLIGKLQSALKAPKHGWLWQSGAQHELTAAAVASLWHRYLEYESGGVVLRGLVAANQGRHYLSGRVFVTDTPTSEPPEGSILVVPATSPTFVPLMRRAKALVTDHGGIMSHAAIVAREFGLPCIVGTKEGTKVLQTGDEVVLDLVKGEITK